MLCKCWAIVCDASPTLNCHWFCVFYLLGNHIFSWPQYWMADNKKIMEAGLKLSGRARLKFWSKISCDTEKIYLEATHF